MKSESVRGETIGFPVVGVGASAGGLTALRRLVSALPERPGVALIVVQHHVPNRPSELPAIAAAWTRMPVRLVVDGERVQANHVYVAPPGCFVTLDDGVLHSRPMERRPGAPPESVDRLFESLSRIARRAAAVVLSGTGSDGTVGAMQIKAAGGVVLAQAPESAEFPDMPSAAIRAGVVDEASTPEELARKLATLATPDRGIASTAADAGLDTLEGILEQLRARAGLDLRGYKVGTTLRRVRRRMELRRVERWSDYAELLRQDRSELDAMAQDVLIHVTQFFRDEESWRVLERDVIAPLFEERRAGDMVRAWTAACSTGEEAYSLAMLLLERAEATPGVDFQLFATDVAPEVVARARRGVYPPEALSTLSAERRRRFFEAVKDGWRARRDLREKIVFAPHNVLADPPFSTLDLITCRNLLIYLEKPAKTRALSLLAHALRPGGWLFLGDAERITDEGLGFEALAVHHGVWRKRTDVPRAQRGPMLAQPSLSRGGTAPDAHDAEDLLASNEELSASKEELRVVNEELGTVNEELGTVNEELTGVNAELAEANLQLHVRIAELQTQSEVLSSGGVVALFLDPDLRLRWFADLAGAVWPFRATDLGRPIDDLNAKVHDPRFVDDARAALASGTASERETPARDGRVWLRRMGPRRGYDGAPQGVAVTYVDVTALREAEAALREREERLRTVLEGVGEAFYALDRDQRFLFVSRSALELWGKTAEDVLGRPFLACFPQSEGSEPYEAHRRVMTTGSPERLVTISPVVGRWIEVDLAPTPTGGLSVAFRDIDARKRAEDGLRQSEARLHAFVTASSNIIYRMSPDWTEMRRLEGRDLLADMAEPSQDWLDAYIHPDDRAAVLPAIDEAIRTKSLFELEHRVRRADGGLGWVLARAVPILDETGEIVEWFGTAQDISRQRDTEARLQASEERYRRLFDAIDQGFCVIELIFDEGGRPIDYRFIEVNAAFEGQTGLRDAVGKTMRELAPEHEPHWLEIYGHIAMTGEATRFEAPARALGHDYEAYAFRFDDPALRRVGVLLDDVSKRRRPEGGGTG